jgi:trehalose 6-phosphate phosphatase
MGHGRAIESKHDATRSSACSSAQPVLSEPPVLSADRALLLDFDGTLVRLAPRPDAVRVEADLPALLIALQQRLGGAFAILTGRLLQDVDPRLAPLRFIGAGLHGAQMRFDPAVAVPVARDDELASIANALMVRLRHHPNILIEDKGRSIAVHFRQAPEAAEDCRAALAALIEPIPTLEMLEGHCVVEARRRGTSKGHAVNALLDRAPFAGRMPVVLGDDRTDEDAFAAADRHGGYGVRVGPEPTAARYRLADVAAVHRWLRASLGALS